jgi:hypothetical protein
MRIIPQVVDGQLMTVLIILIRLCININQAVY